MADFAEIRRTFALREDLVWLNNCGISAPPQSSVQATKDYLDAYAAESVLQKLKPHGHIKHSIQSTFARLLGGSAHEYAIMNNTAEGMTFIAQSLALSEGDAILLVEREYPSNVYPFLQLKRRGVAVDFVSPGEHTGDFIKNIEAKLTPRVKAMSLSAVDWLTGRAFDLKAIGALLKKHNVVFILDAAQGAGHVPIDVKTLGVDAMAFSCWKWFLGPLGSGALYVSDGFIHALDIRVAGTSSVKNDEMYLPHREEYKETAERFMLSTAPYTNWVFLENSLRFLDGIGFEVVRARLMHLADTLSNILRRRGFTLLRDSFGAEKSAIVVARRAGNMAELHAALTQAGVVCALREGNIRLSPHLNCHDADFEKLDRILEQILTRET